MAKQRKDKQIPECEQYPRSQVVVPKHKAHGGQGLKTQFYCFWGKR